MKKIYVFITIAIVALMSSCGSKENSIKTKFEDKIKTELLDPTSYQFVSMVGDSVKLKYPDWSEYADQPKTPGYGFMKDCATWMKNNPTKSISFYKFKFRAKSKLGLDVLGTYTIFTSPEGDIIAYRSED